MRVFLEHVKDSFGRLVMGPAPVSSADRTVTSSFRAVVNGPTHE